jgi:AcrR family transcriptional regulator
VTVTDHELGLRERKKLRTQRELREAGLRLFQERGFDHVAIDDIAAAAEVSKTTFYRYFDSKEDVLLGNLDEGIERMEAALAARPADEPAVEAVRNAILDLMDDYGHDRELTLAKGRIMRDTPSLQARNRDHQVAWEAVLARFVAERLGVEAHDLVPRVIAANLIATMRVAVDQWLASGGRSPLHTTVADALELVALPSVPADGPHRSPRSRRKR